MSSMEKGTDDFMKLVIVGAIGVVTLGCFAYFWFKGDSKNAQDKKEKEDENQSEEKKEVSKKRNKKKKQKEPEKDLEEDKNEDKKEEVVEELKQEIEENDGFPTPQKVEEKSVEKEEEPKLKKKKIR